MKMARTRLIDRFLEDVTNEISVLTHAHRLAFCASCCERAPPNYELFVGRESWGTIEPFRKAVDTAWSVAEGHRLGVNLGQLREECKSWAPHSDDFPSAEAAAAQDAALMTLVLLEHLTDPDPDHCRRVASFARDSVDMCVQLTEELNPAAPDLEDRIEESTLMQREIGKQREDIAVLERQETVTPEFIRRFREASLLDGKSNLGLLANS